MSQLGVTVNSKPTMDGVLYYLTLVANDFKQYEKDSLNILSKFLEKNSGNISEIDRISKIEPLINYLTIDKGLPSYKDVYEQHFEKITQSNEVSDIVS